MAGCDRQRPGRLRRAAHLRFQLDRLRAGSLLDALDAIGIQAYFPVLDRSQIGDRIPSQAELDAGWARIMDRLRAFGQRHDRTIVFTELGYNLSAKAPYEPWDWDVGGDHAAILQERCMRAALGAIGRERAVVGAFLWKWFPGERLPRDFAMASPAMRRVISEHWSDDLD